MQYPTYHTTGDAASIPVPVASANFSVAPIEFAFPGRQVPLQVRVTFPATASSLDKLPVVIFSHGGGPSSHISSLHGYAPVREFWASHGLVVIQPTHLDSKSLALDVNPGNVKQLYLDARAADVSRIIDELLRQDNAIERAIPLLKGKLDTSKVAMAGHSFGAFTTSTILGAINHDNDDTTTDVVDTRVKAGVIFAGTGYQGLSEQGKAILPFYDIDFSTMKIPALVVYGDEDVQPFLTTRGADWHADPYTMSPGRKALLTLKGAKHGLGGIAGWDVKEADDDDIERLYLVLKTSWAYLWSALHDEGTSVGADKGAWAEVAGVVKGLGRMAELESKE
ncbi:Alpha/Beta hydrolase protein [Microdochium trichocladiopsis]|uniref:1-alkyl-2-acetylglycerophosphocholine esterase n=1 Tax=Microdochium trichocladiopsis TaxID=1682393 RepID=A0A9P9BLJ4_9PEZI|nr:Alpha/Beta hydrolase protein [Microdochium trichocladiopsis]KAH7024972.1 Alpha/Beta hydrolase protein [Microdochium trichocladiopsis]